jgi:hypothetical protein
VNDLKLALLIPDTHRPFHHKKAYDLMINVATFLPINEIVIMGDYADFYSVSSHAKSPDVFNMLKDEVESVNEGLDELDELFPEAKKVYLEGNHEYRLERYLVDKAPALFGITSMQHLLKLDQRPNWIYVPYGPSQLYNVLNSHLHARHEPLSNSTKATAQRAMLSLTFGHVHSIEENHVVSLDGKNHVSFCGGWLGNKRFDKVFSYVKNYWQWQLGFVLVYVNPVTGFFYHQKIHILEDETTLSCVVNGKLFKCNK